MSWIDDALNKAGKGLTKEAVKDEMRKSIVQLRSFGWDNEDIRIFICASMGEKMGVATADLMAKWLWEIFNEETEAATH